jgi:RNA polymerase sigma-70 factor (ECF subfamily)
MTHTHAEIALVLAAREEQPGALRELLDTFVPIVLQWCYRMGGPRVDPEDAAHDVMEIVLKRLHSLRDPACFRSWIYGITRRVIMRHRGRAWVRRVVSLGETELEAQITLPDRQAQISQTGRQVQLALEKLPHVQREVLVLHELEERGVAEVAELLDVPVGTVKSRLRLGRQRLRRVVVQMGISPELAEGAP